MKPEPGSFETDVVAALQRLAAETVAPTPPPFATLRLRAEFARRQQVRARRDPVQTYVPAAIAVVLVAGLFGWMGAPPEGVVRGSIELATSASRILTGGLGLGLALFLGFAMLAFVLMEEGRQR